MLWDLSLIFVHKANICQHFYKYIFFVCMCIIFIWLVLWCYFSREEPLILQYWYLIYDFSYFRIWDHSLPNPSLSVLETHSEFVYGLDFSNHVEGLLADCAWDQSVGIYHVLKPGNSGPLTHGGATWLLQFVEYTEWIISYTIVRNCAIL